MKKECSFFYSPPIAVHAQTSINAIKKYYTLHHHPYARYVTVYNFLIGSCNARISPTKSKPL